ncbi:DNA cytosine methyltransferase [Nocardioides sp. NPDC101246]|uniref:DNA cytosine methyltransferase n=1 Tax=Nocardioides sp. NPDC101246 TaxID=3364336 RepID=UPI003802A959
MSRPKLLDLFCCAGGCSMGYYDAGFDVVGVDLTPRLDYPFEFIESDAMDVLADHGFLSSFDIVHTSPPCQHYSVAANAHGNADDHPDLVAATRDALRSWGGPYVIENVPTAPLIDAVLICGWAMGLRHIKRHRLFETNMPLMSPGCLCPEGDTVSVFGHSGEDRRKSAGGMRKHVPIAEVRELMCVPWIKGRDEVSESIPPPYTEFLGAQILDYLEAVAA